MKIKENENNVKYLDLARQQKAVEQEGNVDTNYSWFVWNGPQMIRKELEIRGKIETIQTTGMLRSTRILRKILVSWGDLPGMATNNSQEVKKEDEKDI